jgi:hypothetical protein
MNPQQVPPGDDNKKDKQPTQGSHVCPELHDELNFPTLPPLPELLPPTNEKAVKHTARAFQEIRALSRWTTHLKTTKMLSVVHEWKLAIITSRGKTATKAAKKMRKELIKKTLLTVAHRTYKFLMARTLQIWRGLPRATTTAAVIDDSSTQLDSRVPSKKRSSNIRRQASKRTRVELRASDKQDRQTAREIKRRKWNARMETLLMIASRPGKKQTVTMAVILQRTPKPTTEVLQTYYPPGKLFAQASTPTQSPPRRGRYKTIQRGSWKQPRKIFQRRIRNGETVPRKNQHE